MIWVIGFWRQSLWKGVNKVQRLSILGMTTVEEEAKETGFRIRCDKKSLFCQEFSPGTWSWGWPCGRRSPWTRSPSPRCRGRGSSPRSWAPRQRAAEQNTFWVLIPFCFGILDFLTGLGHHVITQLNTILRVTLDCKPTMEWHCILQKDILVVKLSELVCLDIWFSNVQ